MSPSYAHALMLLVRRARLRFDGEHPRHKRGAVITALADLNAAVETTAEGHTNEDLGPIRHRKESRA